MVPSAQKGRLIIASNRLPVSIEDIGQGQYEFKASSGGLVTGLRGLANSGLEFLWYGWPGIEISKENVSHLRKPLLDEHNAVPVLLDQHTADLYYNGFSNSTIWPLFHYQLDKVLFDESSMAAYRRANETFAETIMSDLEDGDHVWVHDYHLMLLPLMLRQRAEILNINIHLGWFLHIPFPGHDFLDVLPFKFKRDILDGILGADLVGFQTDQARHNFLATCSQTLKWWSTDTGILCGDREVSVRTFPIGIEPSEFHRRLRRSSVQDTLRKMKDEFRNKKVILGVDRLDCIKGIPQKLRAFDMLLERSPEFIGDTILVQVVVPSRDNLKAHQDLKEEIHQLVGKINGRYGKVNWAPVHFLYTSLDPDELTALYTAADVCFVSSTRDGMNLVCYEFVACHNEKAAQSSREIIAPGSLVLSKFAGAANLLDGALIVNPWDKENCAEALAHALSMNGNEAYGRMKKLGDKMDKQTSSQWGSSFIHALELVGKTRTAKERRRDSAVASECGSMGRNQQRTHVNTRLNR